MPVYEYRCTACQAELEAIVLPGEQAPDRCEACGGPLKRLWSRVGVQLVGWGFARNDSLLPETGGTRRRSYREVKDKAAELFD